MQRRGKHAAIIPTLNKAFLDAMRDARMWPSIHRLIATLKASKPTSRAPPRWKISDVDPSKMAIYHSDFPQAI
jgi:hypothetical protein